MSGYSYSPFWDFVDSIDDNLNQFNRALEDAGFNRESKNQVSKQINNKKETPSNSLTSNPFGNSLLSSFQIVPPVDLLNHKKNFELHVSIPGVERDKISLEFSKKTNKLTISGEIESHKEEENDNYKLHERSTGKFSRSINFPSDEAIEDENIEASYKDGVLVVVVPKSDKKQIENTCHITIN